ncbi:hypothetical protein [Agromyces sp. Leaf222]|uniref:hypothetical protein n=1 Tax=Agromyces sp. Leaf222 TaxID=1735688 RepID=UPI0006F32D2D|nr:hypothetical protein [Agromyces sp. Leaf222]KQM83991.1 hypothetical protein ASE68_12915 [Agromyces sp. Leaf222]
MSTELSPRARFGLAAGTVATMTALAFALAPLPAIADDAVPDPPAAAAEASPTSSEAAPTAEAVEAPDAAAVVVPEEPAAEEPPAAGPVADEPVAEPEPEASAPEAPAAPADDTEPAAAEPAPATDEPAEASVVGGDASPGRGDVAPAVEAPEVVVAAPEDTVEETLAADVEEPTVTLFAAAAAGPIAAALPTPGSPCYPAVCITNGTILLAVNPTGELNTTDATGSAAGPGDAGLAYLPTGNDSTSPGCLCEGWGVADPASGVWGGADLDTEGPGGTNLVVESFEFTGSTATSVVLVNDAANAPVFRVTHQYVPSPATKNLYQVNVIIENVSGAPIATVQYRRLMDWDIEPTAFDEFVTIDGGSASALFYTSDDGFASPNPLSGPSSILFEGNGVDQGPGDHGALFDFRLGGLAAGASLSFVIFYGAAATEAEAQAALGAVGAEAYSFGQSSLDPSTGTPNTFIFAFGKVGGTPLFTPEGTPSQPGPVAQPAAPAAVPSVVVVTADDTITVEEDAAPALASTGTEPVLPGLLGLAALVLGGIAVAAGAVARRRNA